MNLAKGGSFGFLGFEYRASPQSQRSGASQLCSKLKKRTELLRKLKEIFRRYQSQPVGPVIALSKPILRGWVNYFSVGHSSRCFSYVKDWVEKSPATFGADAEEEGLRLEEVE